jgi:glycosyltransferase involved in cell wall biosynthesis
LRILIAHNRYQQAGGEDLVVAAETALLRRKGHEVFHFLRDNKDLAGRGGFTLGAETIWSGRSYREIAAEIRACKPDLVHFHNTLPLISPAAIHAAKALGVATVQTLHNYRIACPNAQFFRDGRPCRDCLGKPIAWPGVIHGCYRGSRTATAAVAAMNAVHRQLGTWTRKIDRHIALTEAGRAIFIDAGLPAERIAVKPNFLEADPGPGDGQGRFVLFAGRLSAEKGIRTLLAAWQERPTEVPLKIAGDGPLAEKVASAASDRPGIEWLGQRPRGELLRLMGEATAVLAPAEWEEPFGLTVIEALARGTPVVGADIGAIGSLVEDRRTGRLHRPADPSDLAAKLGELLALPATEMAAMRAAARRTFVERYTADRNYDLLMEVYGEAVRESSTRAP